MSSLPRLDEIETLLQDELEKGNITKYLEKDLINELKEINILEKLIYNRIEKFIQKTIEIYFEPDIKTEQDQDKSEHIDKIAHEWFESQVDKYYLEKRDNYERISFQMFRTGSKRIANEVHQRLIEQEESWKSVNERWGLEADKRSEGKYFRMRPSQIYEEAYKELKRLTVGEISAPIRVGRFIAILKLLKWNEIELNESLREKIKKDMYEDWLNECTHTIIKKLN